MIQQLETNWARNTPFSATRRHRPEAVAEVQEIVRASAQVRVVGSGHSFNTIADTPGDLLWLGKLNRVLAIDAANCTVTVEAGIRYGELAPVLHAAGWALHNMASLQTITVAGAIATATHGSGDRNGNLATAVRALEIVNADGDLVTLSRETLGDDFDGAVVALGALGVVVRITLAIEPAFDVQQVVYENLPVAQLEANFDEITAAAYSVSLFTDWRDDTINQVWLKHRVSPGGAGVRDLAPTGAHAVQHKIHPISSWPPDPCTEQLGSTGPWHERLPHFQFEPAPTVGDELQTEYFVPREHAIPAMRVLARHSDKLAPLLFISEVRTIAADALWLSSSYQRDGVGLHFTWKPNWPGVRAVLPVIEAELAQFNMRPHWGKLCTLAPAQVAALYPKATEFAALRARLDPAGKFRNEYVAALGC